MIPNSTVTLRVAANLIVIAIGYLIKKLSVVSREDGRVLNRLVLYVTLPAASLLALSDATLSWALLLLPVLLFAVSIAICAGGILVAQRLNLAQADKGTFVVSLCGFMLSMAYPFFEAGYGQDGVRAVAVCDIGNAIAIFGIAYALSFRYAAAGKFDASKIVTKIVTFPPNYALLIGLGLNLANVQPGGLAEQTLALLARSNSPLMLLSLGMYLELDISWREARLLLTHTAFKYGAGLAMATLVIVVLPVRGAVGTAAFLTPLMPTSLSTLLYSVEQGLNPRLAAMLISTSMLISMAVTAVTMIWFQTAF